jgi:hypothetical protein
MSFADFRLIRVTSRKDSAKSEYMASLVPDKSETRKPKLLEEVRRLLRFKHYRLRTEEAYLD